MLIQRIKFYMETPVRPDAIPKEIKVKNNSTKTEYIIDFCIFLSTTLDIISF
jgi:hypothetical protein